MGPSKDCYPPPVPNPSPVLPAVQSGVTTQAVPVPHLAALMNSDGQVPGSSMGHISPAAATKTLDLLFAQAEDGNVMSDEWSLAAIGF